MNERNVIVTTRHGDMPAFAVCPDGAGPWPGVLFYMDARGIREELRNMARRIARSGYFVLMPDLYYRIGDLRFNLPKRDETMIRIIREASRSITMPLILDDTAGMLAWLAAQDKVKIGPVGTVGYCQGGPFVTWAAAEFPSSIASAASLYGVRMVSDLPTSPHLSLPRIKVPIYYGFAEKDHFSPPDLIAAFKAALDKAGNIYELDVYPGNDHGFCFPERDVYAAEASEQHWRKLLALFARTLPA